MLTGRLPIRNGFYSDNFRGRNGNCIKSSNMRANGYFFIFILHNCSLHAPGDRRRNPRLGNPNIRVVARQGWISHQAGRQVAPRAQRAGAKKNYTFFLKSTMHSFFPPKVPSPPPRLRRVLRRPQLPLPLRRGRRAKHSRIP